MTKYKNRSVYKCGYCRRSGHTSKLCPNRKADAPTTRAPRILPVKHTTDLRAKLRPVIDTIVTELVEQAVAGVVGTVTARLIAAMRFEQSENVTLVVAKEAAPSPPPGSWADMQPNVVDRDITPPKQARAATVPKGSQIKCTVCGELGHNARSHKVVSSPVTVTTRSAKGEVTSVATSPPLTPKQADLLARIKSRGQAPQ